mgnify:CR=1 FL=1
MVGHTGIQAAAIAAVEAVDECVGKTVEALKEVGGQMFICADHGNAEQLIDYETGAPFTAHTTNPVPFIPRFFHSMTLTLCIKVASK